MATQSYLEEAVFKEFVNLSMNPESQVSELPGTPDIVFRGARVVVFVNGCYWHNHICLKKKNPKHELHKELENFRKLRSLGYTVKILWECDLRNNFRQKIYEVKELLTTDHN